VLCIAPKKSSRLRYLKQQVITGIFSLADAPYFGFSEGNIEIHWPSWTRVQIEDNDSERSIYAGKWSFDVVGTFAPEELAEVFLAAAHVDSTLWSADYSFGD
jgi:hypothetical protein